MPTFPDPPPTTFRTREWLRLAVASVTNFAILTAPCQEIGATGGLPYASDGDEMLLAALLPDKEGPLLDAGGQPSFAAPASRLSWRAPARTRYWRSPELPPQAARSTWPTEVVNRGSLVRETQATTRPPSPFAEPFEPWQPGALPSGGDPLPPPGVFGALPIEQQVGTGVIYGEVASGLDPVAKALVDVIGTGRVAETDAQGRFRIEGLPAGDFTVEASALNYSPQTLGVSPNPTTPTELRFNLTAKPTEGGSEEYTLEEETIVGEYNETSQGDFNLSLTADSPNITSGVNRDDFKKTAVSDAGEAIAKVSGANIVDGKYAVVRGLADRYITTTFNGAQISSSDPSRKAVQLDLFPTNVIEAILVDKTYRPELAGDFGGGAIDIITRAFPEERILSFKSKLNYNDALNDKIYVHPDRKIGTWGDLGPAMPPSLEAFNPDGSTSGFIDRTVATPEELQARYRQLHNSSSMRPVLDDSEMGYSYSGTYGETFTLANDMRLGVMLSGGYSNGDSSNTTPVTNQVRTFNRDDYTRGIDWVLFGSAALEINDYNHLQATYFKRRSAEDSVQHSRQIIDDEENLNYGFHMPNTGTGAPGRSNDYGTDFIYYGTAWDIVPLTRDLEILQAQGTHGFSDRSLRLNWSLTDSNSIEARPHSTHFEYGTLDFSSRALADVIAASNQLRNEQAVIWAEGLLGLENPETYTWETIRDPMLAANQARRYDRFATQTEIIPDDSRDPVETLAHALYTGSVPGKQRSSRRSEETRENSFHSQFSAEIPFYFEEGNDENFFEIGLGMSKLKKSRATTARQYDLFIQNNSAVDSGYPGAGFTGPGGRAEDIAGNPSLIGDDFTGNTRTGPFYLNALTNNGLENISTQLKQDAWHLGGRLEYENFFIAGGVRHEEENYEIDIAGIPLSSFTDEQIAGNGWETRAPEESLLPSITAGISTFNDRLDWLVGWSETVARPTFWEFIPSQTFDQANGIGRRGNNRLKPTEITNFDFAVSYRPNERTVIRTSLFHKDLLNPLVNFIEDGTLLYADSFVNSDGTEIPFTSTINGIELEAEIYDLGPFSLKGNFTYISAILDYTYVSGGVATEVSSQLPYQPETILNLNLGYEHEPSAIAANLVYNFTGSYPTVLKQNPSDLEVRRDSISTIDLVLAKTIPTDHGEWVIRGGVKNLLDATDTLFYGEDIFYEDKLGRSYFLEVEASF